MLLFLVASMIGFYWLVGMLEVFSGFPLPLCILFASILCLQMGGRIALMAFSGTFVWLGMDDSGNMPQWTRLVLDFHQFMATFAWIYLGGHAGMALLHQLSGDNTLARMFSLRR